MRKTVTITIGGALFHIEEDAYEALDTYLQSIRSHFSKFDEHEEIVADIESRIAEEFTDLLKENKRAAINEIDVTTVCANMGTVEDFQAFESDAPKSEKEEQRKAKDDKHTFGKKLYRDSDDILIAGIASGIAKYIGIDPWIVRGIFLASLIFGGAGAAIYVVLWMIIPEAKTIGDKTEMRGGKLTLEKIEATIREKVPEATKNIDKNKLKRLIDVPFAILRKIISLIGRIIRGIIPFIGRLLGVLISTGAMFGMFFITFWLIIFLTGSWEQYMDVPVRELAGNAVFYSGVLIAYMLLIIPGIGLFAVGMSLSKMKNAFTFPAVLALGIIWLSSALSGAVLAASVGPAFVQKVETYTEEFRTKVTRDINIAPFTNLDVSHSYDVNVRTGKDYDLKVTGSERAIAQLHANVENGTLTIYREGRGAFCIFCLDSNATIELTVPEELGDVHAQAGVGISIDGVDVIGKTVSATAGSKVRIENATLAKQLTLQSHAGSSITLDVVSALDKLTTDVAAGSRVEFTGSSTTMDIKASAGSWVMLGGKTDIITASVNAGSRLQAAGLTAQDANINVAAGGNAEITVTRKLTGSAHAGGRIYYVGSPEVIDVDTDPSGIAEPLGAAE